MHNFSLILKLKLNGNWKCQFLHKTRTASSSWVESLSGKRSSFLRGCALNGRPEAGGGWVNSSISGGMYTGCGGMGTGLPQPIFISNSIMYFPESATEINEICDFRCTKFLNKGDFNVNMNVATEGLWIMVDVSNRWRTHLEGDPWHVQHLYDSWTRRTRNSCCGHVLPVCAATWLWQKRARRNSRTTRTTSARWSSGSGSPGTGSSSACPPSSCTASPDPLQTYSISGIDGHV